MRDLDIVVVDEAVGFGNGKLLPRGPLREPLSALRRAGLLWLKSSGGEAHPSLSALRGLGLPIVRALYRPSILIAPDGSAVPLQQLSGQRVTALVGIARPSSFTSALTRLGSEVVSMRVYEDHVRYAITAEEWSDQRSDLIDRWLG